MFTRFTIAAVSVAATLAGSVPASAASNLLTPAADVPQYRTIVGDGSTWAANAVNQWVSDVARHGERVVFTSDGSARGRSNFAAYNNDFAVTDSGFQGVDPHSGATDSANGRAYAYVPLAAGAVSFPYHLTVGGSRITDLRLSGATLAGIFTNHIVNWNDPAITADNNGRQLPSIPIIPVVHSEGAGVTRNFTQYLGSQYPALWSNFSGGSNRPTEYFPASGNDVTQTGSDGVINYVTSASGQGSIGYDEYSYALGVKYPVAKVENSAGYYTLPTQFNVAVALTAAKVNDDPASTDYMLADLSGVYTNPDPRSYPLSAYSSAIIPTSATDSQMNSGKRQTLADFLSYSVCSGQAEVGPIGVAPLPENLVSAAFTQISKLGTADPNVVVSSTIPSNCGNPTFDASDPMRNLLAVLAPLPVACDHVGAGPCAELAATQTPTPPPTPIPPATPMPTAAPTPTPTPLPRTGTHTYALSASAVILGAQISFGGTETLTTTAAGAISGIGVIRAGTLHFLLYGSVPVTARVGVVPGAWTGAVNRGQWSLGAPVRLAILTMSVGGAVALTPANQTCQTPTRGPLTMQQTSVDGNTLTFAATLGVSSFSDCGPSTTTINSLVAGQTNYLTVRLTELA